MKFIQRFRTVVNFAQGTGLITADPFANYKLKFEHIERGYLDKGEISKICNKEFVSKRLEQVRFIFSYYTGFSYVDICKLTNNDIRLTLDNSWWIIKKRPVEYPILYRVCLWVRPVTFFMNTLNRRFSTVKLWWIMIR